MNNYNQKQNSIPRKVSYKLLAQNMIEQTPNVAVSLIPQSSFSIDQTLMKNSEQASSGSTRSQSTKISPNQLSLIEPLQLPTSYSDSCKPSPFHGPSRPPSLKLLFSSPLHLPLNNSPIHSPSATYRTQQIANYSSIGISPLHRPTSKPNFYFQSNHRASKEEQVFETVHQDSPKQQKVLNNPNFHQIISSYQQHKDSPKKKPIFTETSQISPFLSQQLIQSPIQNKNSEVDQLIHNSISTISNQSPQIQNNAQHQVHLNIDSSETFDVEDDIPSGRSLDSKITSNKPNFANQSQSCHIQIGDQPFALATSSVFLHSSPKLKYTPSPSPTIRAQQSNDRISPSLQQAINTQIFNQDNKQDNKYNKQVEILDQYFNQEMNNEISNKKQQKEKEFEKENDQQQQINSLNDNKIKKQKEIDNKQQIIEDKRINKSEQLYFGMISFALIILIIITVVIGVN